MFFVGLLNDLKKKEEISIGKFSFHFPYEQNSPQIHAAAYKTSATVVEFAPRIKT
jgi:hypothetical protein